MTITLFIMIAAICCVVSAALTEGIKVWRKNAGKNYSANFIALINSLIVGGVGTAIIYVLMGIPFIATNIICIFLMIDVVWLGSMLGYDKVMQLIKQITKKDE